MNYTYTPVYLCVCERLKEHLKGCHIYLPVDECVVVRINLFLSLYRVPGGNPGSNCTKHNHVLLFSYTSTQSSHLHQYSQIHTNYSLGSYPLKNKPPFSTLGITSIHFSFSICLEWFFLSLYWLLSSALATTPTFAGSGVLSLKSCRWGTPPWTSFSLHLACICSKLHY